MSLGHRVRPCPQTKQPTNHEPNKQTAAQASILDLGIANVDSVAQSGVVLAEERCPVENQDSVVSC